VKYGPVFLILQAITLIGIEKLGFLFPRSNQRLERFYKSVEEALLGKDPDVAEDFSAGQLAEREAETRNLISIVRFQPVLLYLYGQKEMIFVFCST
jgi:hypothetical protein